MGAVRRAEGQGAANLCRDRTQRSRSRTEFLDRSAHPWSRASARRGTDQARRRTGRRRADAPAAGCLEGMNNMATRCGFVAVLGAPNSGKSTLVNTAVGQKVSIVTQKVQTTRMPVRGIAMRGDAQLIFVDTPGIFAPRRRLDRAMVQAAWGGAADADVVLLTVDSQELVRHRGGLAGKDTNRIIEGLKTAGRRAALVLNKVDAVKREALLPLAEELNAAGIFDRVFMISALSGDGVDDLMTY